MEPIAMMGGGCRGDSSRCSRKSTRSRQSSSRAKKQVESLGAASQDQIMLPATTDLEVMAKSLRADHDLKWKQRNIVNQSLMLANLGNERPERTNEPYHSSADLNIPYLHMSQDETVPTTSVPVTATPKSVHVHHMNNTTPTPKTVHVHHVQTESRHPSPSRRDTHAQTVQPYSMTPSMHKAPIGGSVGVVDVDAESDSSQLMVEQSKATTTSHQSTRSSVSHASSTGSTLEPSVVVTSKKTLVTGSAQDIKLSSQRLEVLVLQLRETPDEKEAATIILEIALRLKNHELVVSGADLSVINAMKRFSNSSKIQTRGCKALAEMATKGMVHILSIIDKGGPDMILIAMAKHRAEEDLQKEACRAIQSIAMESDNGKQSFGADSSDAIAAILHAMKDHLNASKLQRMACRALSAIATDSAPCSKSLVNLQGLDSIRRTLKNHDDNTEVIESAFDVLISIASAVNQSELDEEIAANVSMDRVLATMLLYRKNERMQIQGIALLCMLCKQSHRNRSKIATLYGLEVITKSMENCIINKEVQRHGTTLIQYLSQSEGNGVTAGLISDGGMELLLNIIRRHQSDPIIVQQVDLIISKLSRPFSDVIRKEGGIELIISGMRRHETNVLVQEAACLALWKLAAKKENANVITGHGGVNLVNNALTRFPMDQNIQEVACEALAALSHDKQLMMAQQTLKARATAAVEPMPPRSSGCWGCGACC